MCVSINTLDNCKLSDCIFDLNHNTIVGSIPISTWRVLFFKLQQKGQSTQNEKKLFKEACCFSAIISIIFSVSKTEKLFFSLFHHFPVESKYIKMERPFSKPKLCK